MNLTSIYSPNFDLKKRTKNQIKFIVFHYTGMKSEKLAIRKLTTLQSGVSSHYFIKKNGEVILMVPDLYTAWHAGISSWKNYNSLNTNSIGIEISNPGHKFGYTNFTKKQIKSLIKLSKFLIHKYKIKKNNVLGHSDIAPERKMDPGEKFPWELLCKNKIGFWHKLNSKKLKILRGNKISIKNNQLCKKKLIKLGYSSLGEVFKNHSKFNKFIVKAFQRRFRPALINGQIDQECMVIINELEKSQNNKKIS
jgi:N-acetylmuramoyl-L-alanine amidase